MRRLSGVLIFLAAALAPHAAWSSEIRPVGVSPGGQDRFLTLRGRCPTFSWSAVRGALAYELVVFEVRAGDPPLGPDGSDAVAEPGALSLRARIPGAALSWTPAADSCLEPGSRYAWLVRAVTQDGAEPWSEARRFEIGAAPSREEVVEALETLHRYLEEEEAEGVEPGLSPAMLDSIVAAAAGNAGALSEAKADVSPAASAVPDGFEVGLWSQPVSAVAGTIGVYGATESAVNQSIGVLGEAASMTGVADGVRGVSASVGGTGVRGSANALAGTTAGVWGSAVSPLGYGGFFFNIGLGDPGGTALYASGALNTSPDLVLGGNFFWAGPAEDDGRIHSDPAFPSSDLILRSNDAIRIDLDADGDGEDADFTIRNKDGQDVFNVDEDGTTFILGDLAIIGQPLGGLVSLDDVDQLIQAHRVAEHPKIVFVTSSTYSGDLGGLGGADAKCRGLALNAGLLGTFKAWISGDGASEEARDRLTHADVPYRRVDWVKVADSWDDLTDGTLDNPITVDQNGNTVASQLTVYTNTNANGSMVGVDRECSSGGPGPEWNTSSNLESGAYGTVGATNSAWSFQTNDACSNLRRLYCFQQ